MLSKNEWHSPSMPTSGEWLARELTIVVDKIVKPQRSRRLVLDFYRHFPDIELRVRYEVFNGVWDALVDGQAEMAIGATRAVPVGGRFVFRDMGF